MSVLEEYPKTHRDEARRLRAVLASVPGLEDASRAEFAAAINNLANKACDLEDVFQRLLRGPANADELADLLTALELTLEQIRGESDTVDGKLYEMADRLRPEAP
jgi:exonuclease VII small subunit